MKVKVISFFRDKLTGQFYSPGEVIEISDESRVADMELRKLAERIDEKVPEAKKSDEKKEARILLFEKELEKKALVDVMKSLGVQVSGNMKDETLLGKVAEMDKEMTSRLKEALKIN